MQVNWQNIVNKIQHGESAFNRSGFGNPQDTGNISFYDHPMSDLSELAIQDSILKPKIFYIGLSQWGQSDVVDE